jgi:hypothetical protein
VHRAEEVVADAAGSLELIAVELANLLRPLGVELAPVRAQAFLAKSGLNVTGAQIGAMTAALSSVSGPVTDLNSVIADLRAAIDSGGEAEIISKGLQAIGAIGNAISGIATLSASIPGTTGEAVRTKVLNRLIFEYLNGRDGVNDVLDLVGLLDRVEHDGDPGDPISGPYTVATYHFDQIGQLISKPGQVFSTRYGWGQQSFTGQKLLAWAEGILARNNFPVLLTTVGNKPVLDAVFVRATASTQSPPGLAVTFEGSFAGSPPPIALGDAKIDLHLDVKPPFGSTLTISPSGKIELAPPSPGASFEGKLGVTVTAEHSASSAPFLLFGATGGSRLELRRFIFDAGANLAWAGGKGSGAFSLTTSLNGLKLVIDAGSGDGFLAQILPTTKLEGDFDLMMGVASDRGVYFGGSSALEVRLPTHIPIGPISIEGITLGLGIKGATLPLSLGADIKANFGPFVAVVQNMGVTVTATLPPNGGNLGPLQLDIGFKPPSGVGLSIDAGVIKGGGFLALDFDKGEYFGALELSFQDFIDLKAIGIINTKLPDGKEGFALLVLITAEFVPIQLGFGFTLAGVGGLLGVNRTLDTPALMSGVRTGAVESILFPQDIVANISRIISDLKTIFPIAEGHVLIAPMAKIGWGTPTILSVEIGVILDIPVPAFTIIGVLRASLPAEDAPLLKLQVNFAGGIDFDKSLLWFNASLFDSRLILFTLAGDMALRIGWGSTPMFVLSVGGFHPAFHEVPDDLRGMKRMSISLLSGDNPRLTVETYFAVTSNTVQSGARVELYAEACCFNVYGFLGYDLLVQFNPFHFVAAISAGLALRAGTDVIASISVSGQLSGPTPWNVQGDASIQILFFEISVGFDVTWGEDGPPQPVEVEGVAVLVKKALEDDRNWRAEAGANANTAVSTRQLNLPQGQLVLQPFSVLSVSERVVPLGFPLEKFGNKKPDVDLFELTTGMGDTQEVREEFAIANFKKLSDADKVSRPSFERMRSGIRFSTGDATETGARMVKDVTYEMSYVHRKGLLVIRAGLFRMFGTLFTALTFGSAVTRNAFSAARNNPGIAPARIDIGEGAFIVASVTDMTPHAAAPTVKTAAEAYALHDALVRATPSLKGQLQVLSAYELQ